MINSSILDKQKLINAVRVALAYCLGYSLIMYHQGNFSYFITITIGMVLLPYVGATIRQSILRILGILLGGAMGLILVAISSYGDIALISALFVFTTLLMYFATYYTEVGRNNGYAFVASFLALMLVYFYSVQATQLADFVFLFRTWATILGIIIALFSVGIFWPQKVKKTLYQNFLNLWKETNNTLSSIFSKIDGDTTEINPPKGILTLTDNLISQACAESSFVRSHEVSFRLWAALHDRIRTYIRLLIHETEKKTNWSDSQITSIKNIHQVFDELAKNLLISKDRKPQDLLFKKGFDEIKLLEDTSGQYLEKILSYFQKIENCLNNIDEQKKIHPIEKHNWKIDYFRFCKAIRAGVATVFSMYLTIALNWPKAVLVLIFSGVIATLPSTKKQAFNLSLIPPCSAWIATGIVTFLKVFYFPHVNRLPSLLFAIFFIVIFLVYISQGKNKINHLFYFSPLWFAGLMLSSDFYNNTNLEPAYRYAQAISLGSLIGLLSNYILFPTSEEKLLRIRFNQYIGYSKDLLEVIRKKVLDEDLSMTILLFSQKLEKTLGEELKILPQIRSSHKKSLMMEIIDIQRRFSDELIDLLKENRDQPLEKLIQSLDSLHFALKLKDKKEEKKHLQIAKEYLQHSEERVYLSLKDLYANIEKIIILD